MWVIDLCVFCKDVVESYFKVGLKVCVKINRIEVVLYYFLYFGNYGWFYYNECDLVMWDWRKFFVFYIIVNNFRDGVFG